MRKTSIAIATALVVTALLSGCETPVRRVTLDPEIAIRIDQRLLDELPKFGPRSQETLTEAELIFEYSRLTNAYTQCFNDHTALINLLKEIRKPTQ